MRRRITLAALALALLGWWLACLPQPLFDAPYSSVLFARDGTLLSARVAADGQWRLPPGDSLDERYATAARLYEDEYFAFHPGFNPLAVARALRQNWRAGRIVSGASTLTQQTVRLMRRGRTRGWAEKLVELAWATRLELTYSKREILSLYAAHAPFGGNVVGVEAAAWRYYGRPAAQLSWGEAAALAVLPNAPGIVYPGRSTEAFARKRDALLAKLHARGYLDATDLVLAKAEPLPGRPYPLPDAAPHALAAASAGALPARSGSTSRSTLDPALQAAVARAVAHQHARQRANGVHAAAAVVLEVSTGELLAYVGNSACDEPGSSPAVDVARARRSSGSLLKPFLYAGLLDAGAVAPATLVPDVPTVIGGYAPQNFDHEFDGAVPAGEALTRSLNVPHVRLLRAYGTATLLAKLRAVGFATLDRPADDYGLSLILGGGEVTLLDVAAAYRGLAHTVDYYHSSGRQYTSASFAVPRLFGGRDGAPLPTPAAAPPFSAAAAYLTLETLTALTRPGDLAAWRSFAGGRRVAWKTGTSFGHRDAWAVGVTPEYVVAVWTGNADGEGRAGLTGASAAAPLLFEVFDALPATTWFRAPVADMRGVALCSRSGLRAGAHCPAADTTLLPAGPGQLDVCGYHAPVFVDVEGHRVGADCASLIDAERRIAFTLPPAWAHYYRRRHGDYADAPPLAAGCAGPPAPMALVYPRGGRQLQLPRGLSGERGEVVFEVAHRRPREPVHWYLDGEYAGTTRRLHQRGLAPAPGAHELLLVDGSGRELRWGFEVIR